jgi:hypothetical protein
MGIFSEKNFLDEMFEIINTFTKNQAKNWF